MHLPSILHLSGSRDYRLLFLSQTISFFGSMMTFVVLPWQMYQLTHSSLLVGLLGVTEFVPTITMAFVGGALADYVDRRRMVLMTELFMAVSSALLVLNSLLPHPQVWVLFLSTGIAGLNGLKRPSLEALTPRLVPAELMPAVSALRVGRYHAGRSTRSRARRSAGDCRGPRCCLFN